MLHRSHSKALAAMVATALLSLAASAFAATVPSDDEQEVLIKTTLMTFNDANLTGNYSVLYDKSSNAMRQQFTAEKLSAAFAIFRTKKLNIESVVGDDIGSESTAKIDDNGILELKGRFKDDTRRIRYDLKFVHEENAWKMLGINVDYKE
jgi:hypothetical protein